LVIEEFEQLESSLWRSETRFDRAYMDAVLAVDFQEFGRSGRRYNREQALAVESEQLKARLPLEEVTVQGLSGDVVLVTYISEVTYDELVLRANRSSLWVREAGRWRLRFHQGTPIE